MKLRIPLSLHFVLATLVIGAAVGCKIEGLRPLVLFPLIGLAAGLAITCIARILNE
jgi:hypothetical protein